MNQQMYDYILHNYKHGSVEENYSTALQKLASHSLDMVLYSEKITLTDKYRLNRHTDYMFIKNINIVSYPDEKELKHILKNSHVPYIDIPELIPDICNIISEYAYEIEYEYVLTLNGYSISVKKEDIIELMFPLVYLVYSDILLNVRYKYIMSDIKYELETTNIFLNYSIRNSPVGKIRLNKLNLICAGGLVGSLMYE